MILINNSIDYQFLLRGWPVAMPYLKKEKNTHNRFCFILYWLGSQRYAVGSYIILLKKYYKNLRPKNIGFDCNIGLKSIEFGCNTKPNNNIYNINNNI
jgi:hypothetical protein